MEGLRAFKIGEIVTHVTNAWNIGPSYPFYVAMNKRSYAKLTGDIKEVFDTLCGEYREKFALAWNTSDFLGEAFGRQNEVEFIELPEDELERWAKAVEPVFDKNVQSMLDKG